MSANAMLANLEELGIGRGFTDELCEMLETTALFHEFTRPELETLAKYVHAYRAPKGTTLLEEGGRDSYLCIITRGKVDIIKEDADFAKKKLATVREGTALGEMSIIDGFPHSATAITATETDVVMLTKANLEKICNEFPTLGTKLLWRMAWQLSARLRQTSGILIDHIK